MLSGQYALSDHDGPSAVERFTCTEGGDGWSWSATRHDPVGGREIGRLELQDGTEQRLHAEAGGWVLRAGTLADEVLWRRGADERSALAAGLAGTSPAFVLATARRLGLAVGARRRVRLLAVTEPVLAMLLVDQEWSRAAENSYVVTDLATGERRTLTLEGGLLVDGPGVTLTRE